MSKPNRMSGKTRINWLIDAAVFGGALAAVLSGVYFLYVPRGRDAAAMIFDRRTWDNLHTWGGVIMIVAVAVHFIIHWAWVKSTARRIWLTTVRQQGRLSQGAKLNIVIDALVAVGFVVAAVTGIYFLFVPAGGFQGGRNAAWDPGFLFSRTMWSNVHTWSGSLMAIAAVAHFYIHWGWVKKVTANFFRTLPSAVAPSVGVPSKREQLTGN